MKLPDTARLTLSELNDDDAPFIVTLLNDADFLRHIGDKQVRNEADARHYMHTGPMAMYRQHGFGLWKVTDKASEKAVGLCGLLQRDTLPFADLGYAFLPEARGKGWAMEAATACVEHARNYFAMSRLLALVSPDNQASRRLLEKLGMQLTDTFQERNDVSATCVYEINFTKSSATAEATPSPF